MKSEFRTKLELEELRDADDAAITFSAKNTTWRVTAPLVFYSEHLAREITVPAGFITDFASVPRLPVAYLLAGGEADEASVVHDYLYHSHELARADADAVFEEAMAATGQPWWRRKLMWAGVRLFGASPYADDIEEQPKGETP